jgi:hypothetical protein
MAYFYASAGNSSTKNEANVVAYSAALQRASVHYTSNFLFFIHFAGILLRSD